MAEYSATKILLSFQHSMIIIDSYVANLKATFKAHSAFHDGTAVIYSYARQKQEFLGAVHLCKSKICASGAIFAASLTSTLANSALLDYHNFKHAFHSREANFIESISRIDSEFPNSVILLVPRSFRTG